MTGALFGLVVVGEWLAVVLGAIYAFVVVKLEPAKSWLKTFDLTPEEKELKALRARFDRLGFKYFKTRKEYLAAVNERSYAEDPVYHEQVVEKARRSAQLGIDLWDEDE